MMYVPLKHLKSGMKLARDVNCGFSFVPLISAGQMLTDTMIRHLHKHNVCGVYIENEFSDGIELQEFLDPEVKAKALCDIKVNFDNYINNQQVSIQNVREIVNIAKTLVLQVLSKDFCLYNMIEIKDYDNYTYTHSLNVGILSAMMAVKSGLSKHEQEELTVCGLLHDIGKLAIPLEILNKPGKLTEEEFEIIKTHPQLASDILWRHHNISAHILNGITSHHERFNGSGYPRGLKGKEISLYGRILAIADVYDAITSERPYRTALSSKEAIEYMMGNADIQFDYDLLHIFLNIVAVYPVGSFVKLSNGYTGMVIKNYSANTLRPVIRIIEPEESKGQDWDLMNDSELLNITIVDVIDASCEFMMSVLN